MHQINFSPKAQKDLKKISKDIQVFILEKLKFYAKQNDPIKWSKSLVNLPPSTHRFQVRKYRVYFYLENNSIFIEEIKLRGQAYRS